MTDAELDALYTQLCTTMSRLGEPRAPLYLARFAMLAITQLGEPAVVRAIIEAAAEGMVPAAPAQPPAGPAASA